MTKRMLIDATHAEETRVVVLDGNRLENFDVETSTRRQLKGNIYLAKVVRVEPSLQAAFVEYGGNRHGFLAFGEIHPDYYQIPVADRQRLLEMQAEEARHEQEEEDRAAGEDGAAVPTFDMDVPPAEAALQAEPPPAAGLSEAIALGGDPGVSVPGPADGPEPSPAPEPDLALAGRVERAETNEIGMREDAPAPAAQPAMIVADVLRAPGDAEAMPATAPAPEYPAEPSEIEQAGHAELTGFTPSLDAVIPEEGAAEESLTEAPAEMPPPEVVGGDNDAAEESRERRMPPRFSRNYKIQEVIKRRQILLVQVVKEERGTKGAALTTYLSLAGRYCVLMPNSPRGGGISRKITSPADRRRLKEVMAELDLPPGMGLIVRTAGANRPKPEIKRDCEYLLRLWDDIREHTLRSIAPALIYEEANLIKRSIRDIYSRDVDELIVDGEEGWRAARDFMRMLMPSHAKKVQLWQEPQPLFARYGVDAQLDAMLTPIVQLRSGGYLVINQTEALVAIDVNSGRSTRERGIEETALRTNLEAAEEVARQLRLRDLAGLIVIDFIDMELKKHNAQVERRLKDALKADRARIQVGQISHFGLLEMSRQRLRSSLAETSLVLCPHCAGTGHVRSTESAAIHVLRGIEEEAAKRRAAEVVVHVALPVAMYVLNHKRERLAETEQRYAMHVTFLGDDAMMAPQFRIERVRAQIAADIPAAVRPEAGAATAEPALEEEVEDAAEDDEAEDAEAEAQESEGAEDEPAGAATAEAGADGERRRKRRRRRRRGGRPAETGADIQAGSGAEEEAEDAEEEAAVPAETGMVDGTPVEAPAVEAVPAAGPDPSQVEGVPERTEPALAADDPRGNRRRGRRGPRRRRAEETLPEVAALDAEQPYLPAYVGPTPADPFGGQAFDIFDALERVETEAATAGPLPSLPRIIEPDIAPEPVPDTAPEPAADLRMASPEPEAPAVGDAADSTDFAPELARAWDIAAPEAEAPVAGGTSPADGLDPAPAAPDAPPTPANDSPVVEPAVQPILIDAAAAPPAERKRGWWRR